MHHTQHVTRRWCPAIPGGIASAGSRTRAALMAFKRSTSEPTPPTATIDFSVHIAKQPYLVKDLVSRFGD